VIAAEAQVDAFSARANLLRRKWRRSVRIYYALADRDAERPARTTSCNQCTSNEVRGNGPGYRAAPVGRSSISSRKAGTSQALGRSRRRRAGWANALAQL